MIYFLTSEKLSNELSIVMAVKRTGMRFWIRYPCIYKLCEQKWWERNEKLKKLELNIDGNKYNFVTGGFGGRWACISQQKCPPKYLGPKAALYISWSLTRICNIYRKLVHGNFRDRWIGISPINKIWLISIDLYLSHYFCPPSL